MRGPLSPGKISPTENVWKSCHEVGRAVAYCDGDFCFASPWVDESDRTATDGKVVPTLIHSTDESVVRGRSATSIDSWYTLVLTSTLSIVVMTDMNVKASV